MMYAKYPKFPLNSHKNSQFPPVVEGNELLRSIKDDKLIETHYGRLSPQIFVELEKAACSFQKALFGRTKDTQSAEATVKAEDIATKALKLETFKSFTIKGCEILI